MSKLTESTFEIWWKQKRSEVEKSSVKFTMGTIKTLCYLAWMRGATDEFKKEIGILQRATTAMNKRARARSKKKC